MRLLPIVSGAVLVGCALQTKQAAKVDYSDGIDEHEACIIVDSYLREHMAASLGHTGPYDLDHAWRFEITGDVVPVALTNVASVLVDKKTGWATWNEHSQLKR